jgi:UDP-N-acetylmuramate: L-alanyl-gamma-D-glutamyl-meso-diaminopimelate ligase
VSARLGESPFFVVEADEYDSAFFDKRSKFVHYHPRTAIINNIEFDHADIFDDLAAIQKSFHHFVRTIPSQGLVIRPADSPAVNNVIERGCWSAEETVGDERATWSATLLEADASQFVVHCQGTAVGTVNWSLIGLHNVQNALSAIAAARHAGVPVKFSLDALSEFKGVKRRMEVRGTVKGITVYDDFAHHPTAMASTLSGLRAQVGDARIIAIVEARSNTMKMGIHRETLLPSLSIADQVFLLQPAEGGCAWFVPKELSLSTLNDLDEMISAVQNIAQSGDHVLVMSNGGFGGIHQKLLDAFHE